MAKCPPLPAPTSNTVGGLVLYSANNIKQYNKCADKDDGLIDAVNAWYK